MRVRDLIRRFRGDQARSAGVIAGQAVKIRDLETRLESAHAALTKNMQTRSSGTDDQIRFLTAELERRARLIDQLRAGVVDDAQTRQLRYERDQAVAAARGLERRLAEFQAENDGISAAPGAEAVAA
ncbi:hypothetical protein LG634_24865 [Streptomyces bambusae]|uniref:hypothetical protein n=1 Tax=Streptomyces bambusae TaxID=1550616 RepID=UPI001CFE2621|nr:hypothetical protein [Streptomyces bambusae]MCB5168046.1 hypothetical protein [Streptomyces bambusae]